MRIFRAISIAQAGQTPLAWGIFVAGFLFFTAINTTPTVLAMRSRSAPINVDDSYAYLIKAVQMVTCFQQDCPALEDLRSELHLGSDKSAAEPSLQTAHMRWRMRLTTFVVYHPLHSALVALVRLSGLSWESAFDAVRLAGSLFICAAVAYWLLTLWGPGAAGIALGLLMFFPNQGLHFVVPSNLALAIAILLWARITAREGAAEWPLVFGSLAMVAMHPVGRLYAIVSVLLFLLLGKGRLWTRLRSVSVSLSSFIIVLSFALPLVLQRPDFGVPQRPPLPGWPSSSLGMLRYGVWNNVEAAGTTVTNWLSLYGGLTPAAILTVMGFFALPAAQRSKVLKTCAVLMGLVLASLVHVFPGYSAELFERVWIPLVIVLTGSAAHVAWDLLTGAFSYLRSLVTGPRDASVSTQDRDHAFPYFIEARVAFAMVLGIFVVVRAGAGTVQGIKTGREVLEGMRDSQRWEFHAEQPERLLADRRSGDIVLYLDVVPMHFYWTHGALQEGAIYYPALVDPSTAIVLDREPHVDSPRVFPKVDVGALQERERLTSEKMRYVVGWTPLQQLIQNRDGMVPVFEFSSIDYSGAAAAPAGDGELHVVNLGKRATIHFVYETQGTVKTADIAVPSFSSEWLAMPGEVSGNPSGKFSLNMEPADSEVYIKGMRFGRSDLNWPWDQRATLVFNPPKMAAARIAPKSIRFDADEFLPIRGMENAVKIVDDTGSSVLAELVPRASLLRESVSRR